MKCLILAAGYATRLYPLTENFPKPLLEVGGKTILDHLINDIGSSGKVNEYIVVTNHKFAGHFEKWANSKCENENGTPLISVVDDGTSSNETRLGAVKDILFAVEKLGVDEDLLVIAGDNLLDFSLCCFIDYAESKKASCIMRYYEPSFEKLLKCGVVTVDGDELVTEMTEKSQTPATHWCCPPFYYYTRADLSLVPKGIEAGCGTDAPGSFVAWLCGQTRVYAMEMPGSRYDIGNLESYRRVCEEYGGIKK